MSEPILTKATRDGRTVEVYLARVNALYAYRVMLAGEHHATGGLQTFRDTDLQAVGKVAFTPEEAAVLEAATRAAYEAEKTPEQRLAEQRESLARAYQAAVDEQRDAYERALDSRGPEAAINAREAGEAAIQQARQALAAFDAAHPELTTARQAEREERRRRHEWD